MKIAQALNLRKSLNEQANHLLKAIGENAYEADGDPNGLVSKYLAVMTELGALIERVNRTNSAVTLEYKDDTFTLIEARVRRDIMVEMAEKLRSLPSRKTQPQSYGVPANPKDIVLDASKVKQVADSYSRMAREIDDLIQQTNWSAELEA